MSIFDYWLNSQQFGMPREQRPPQMPQQPSMLPGQSNRMMPQGMQQQQPMPHQPHFGMPREQMPQPPMLSRHTDTAPLSAGANVARQMESPQFGASREFGMPKEPGFLQTIGNIVSDFGTAGLRGSQVASAREFGKMQKTSSERLEEEKRQLMLLAMLAQKEEAVRQKNEIEKRRMKHAEDVLGETKRHHNMMAGERRESREKLSNQERKQEKEINAIEQIQKIHPDAIPYTPSMPAKERADFTKDLQVRINEPLGFKKQLSIVDEMLDIVDKNPDISTSFGALIEGKGVVSKWGMNKKDRVDLEKLNNLQKRLALTKVESGVGGARMTVFLEKLINESKVHGGLHPDTIKSYKKNMKSEYKNLLEDSHVARNALKGHKGIRYYVPRSEDIYQDVQDISAEELRRAAGL